MRQTEIRTPIYFKKDLIFARCQQRLEKWQGHERNKELIKAFQQFLFAKGTKEVRVAKLTWELQRICTEAGKDLDVFTAKDVERIVAWINTNDEWQEYTKSDYRRAVKSFFNWYEDEDPRLHNGNRENREDARRLYRYVKKHVITTCKKKSIDYSQIITDEEAKLLIKKGCQFPMERAFIAVLHETGCRIGEFLDMRIKDVQLKDKHAMVRVDGKTGERRIPIIQSLPWLLRWLENHPDKDNPQSLIWVSTHNRWHSKPLVHMGAKRLLQRVFNQAELRKKCNPHHFRHSRASIIAPHYSESILCKIMGWSLGSRQVKTYVHLSAGQVEDAFLNTHGLKESKKEEPKITECVCGTINEAGARYCWKCGKALTVATFLEDEEKKTAAIDEALELLQKIMANPDLAEKFKAFKENKS